MFKKKNGVASTARGRCVHLRDIICPVAGVDVNAKESQEDKRRARRKRKKHAGIDTAFGNIRCVNHLTSKISKPSSQPAGNGVDFLEAEPLRIAYSEIIEDGWDCDPIDAVYDVMLGNPIEDLGIEYYIEMRRTVSDGLDFSRYYTPHLPKRGGALIFPR